jgi:hypothetical protein
MPRHLPWLDHVHLLGLAPVWVDTEGQLQQKVELGHRQHLGWFAAEQHPIG